MSVHSTHNAMWADGFNLVVTSVNDNNYKRNKLDVQTRMNVFTFKKL